MLFEKSSEKIAKALFDIECGSEIEEIRSMRKRLEERGIKDIEFKPHHPLLAEHFREYALKYNWVKDEKELNAMLSAIFAAKSKMKISKAERRDRIIIHCISAIEDLDKILNLMSERIREWYGLHYPELSIQDHEKYAQAIVKYGPRECFEGFSSSMGMALSDDDIKNIQMFAKNIVELYKLKSELNNYLKKLCLEEMPNTSSLIGHMLAARLVAKAGGLEKLAKMSASTIQLLGAEKALFKFMKSKGKGKPPKYGIIYLTPEVSNAPKELKGKVARILSSKLMIAVRSDFFTKVDRSEELKRSLEDEIKKVKETK